MKIVVQRTLESSVFVENKCVGKIDFGLVLLVCLEKGDTRESVEKAVNKILKLRIFEDQAEKMNLNIAEAKGKLLVVSQFTLSWDGQKGHRPSFDKSMPPQEAKVLFRIFCDLCREEVEVETGQFGHHMQLNIQNDGPVTLHLSF